MAAPTDNASAETHVPFQDVRVDDGDLLITAGDSKSSDQIREMQDSDGETASRQHAAAVTRLFGDPITLSELEKCLLYAENGSTLVEVVRLYLQLVEMGTNGKCVKPNTINIARCDKNVTSLHCTICAGSFCVTASTGRHIMYPLKSHN